MNMGNHCQRNRQGKAAWVGLIIVAVVLVIGGGLLVFRLLVPSGSDESNQLAGSADGVADTLSGLTAPVADFDFSVSPISSLDLSGLKVGADLPGGVMGEVSVSTDYRYGGDLSLDTPDISVSQPDLSGIDLAPAQPPASEPPASEPPASEPPASEPPAQSEVSASNCAQFAAMPSAQYCSAVGDPNGRTLCEQCKAVGY